MSLATVTDYALVFSWNLKLHFVIVTELYVSIFMEFEIAFCYTCRQRNHVKYLFSIFIAHIQSQTDDLRTKYIMKNIFLMGIQLINIMNLQKN